MFDILNLISFIVGLTCSFYFITKVIKRVDYVFSLVYIVFFIIFIYPLGIDFWNQSSANYQSFPAITEAVKDSKVITIYSLFTIYFSIIYTTKVVNHLNTKKNKVQLFNQSPILHGIYLKWKLLLHIIIILPIFLVLINPDNEKFIIYGAEAYREANDEISPYTEYIYLSINISVLTIFTTLLIKNRGISSIVPYIPILFFNIWVNGKRNIVILVLFFILFLVYIDRRIKIQTKILIITLILLGGGAFFSFYKTIKPTLNREGTYRVEFFRDHTVKFAIYGELHPEKVKILEYKGQSLLFYIGAAIPREYWENKPMPYAQYITSAALNRPPQFNGWGITNSIFDELICNFGLWIIFLFPFIIFRIIKWGTSSYDSFASILTVLIVCLLFSVQITAYLPIYIFYIIFVLYSKKKMRM